MVDLSYQIIITNTSTIEVLFQHVGLKDLSVVKVEKIRDLSTSKDHLNNALLVDGVSLWTNHSKPLKSAVEILIKEQEEGIIDDFGCSITFEIEV